MRRFIKSSAFGWSAQLARGLGVAILACLLASAALANAGVIKISTMVKVTAGPGAPAARLTISNSGDGTAYLLRVMVAQGRQKTTQEGPARLGPGGKVSLTIPLAPAPDAPGDYPVLVTVLFHNAQGHRFSNITVGILRSGAMASNPLILSGDDAAITGIGRINFHLDLPGSQKLVITIRAFTPLEFQAGQETRQLVLTGPGSQTLPLELRNLSAFDNASYPVFLIAEFDHQGRHHTAWASALVSVRPQGDPLASWRLPLMIAAALLLLIIIGVQLGAHRSQRAA